MKNSYFPPQFVILGYLLIAIGIYFLIISNWIGIIMIPVGFIVAFLNINQDLDIKNMKYKEYFEFLGIKFGKWKDIPIIDYVTVFRERTIQGKNVVSISSHHTEENYKVEMIINRKEKISVAKYANKEKALEKGLELARALDCKLLDYTSGSPKWIKSTLDIQ